jgi:hypothetical protein
LKAFKDLSFACCLKLHIIDDVVLEYINKYRKGDEKHEKKRKLTKCQTFFFLKLVITLFFISRNLRTQRYFLFCSQEKRMK